MLKKIKIIHEFSYKEVGLVKIVLRK